MHLYVQFVMESNIVCFPILFVRSINMFFLKKLFIALSVFIFTISVSACEKYHVDNPDKISIVATIFPEYDWVLQILGNNTDNIELKLLSDGTDMHSFQPSAKDIIDISTCDLFIYIGGPSDSWIENISRNSANNKTLNLLAILGDSVKNEEIVEGMENGDEHESDDGSEIDEHVWLSPQNAILFCNKICELLCEIDPDNSEKYTENTTAYTEKLEKLDHEYQITAENSQRKTILFADRFPFRYLTDEYGLTYYAAFPGCSSESEASFETILFLTKTTEQLQLPYILITESSDATIAETIRENISTKKPEILVLNSMQSMTASDSANGSTYISIMEKNLEVLHKVLN